MDSMNRVEVNPTLVVGVGGTGCHVAMLLRKMVEEEVHLEDKSRMPMRFIGVDTDHRDMSAMDPNEAPLHLSIKIGGRVAEVGMPEDKTESGAAFRAWLPTDRAGKLLIDPEHLARAEGAGGKRLLGRYAFKYFGPSSFMAARRVASELRDITNNPVIPWKGVEYSASGNLEVFIVASVCGGTGSGAFLDVAAMCHMLCDDVALSLPRKIHLVLLLPSAFEMAVSSLSLATHQATAFACLKDLDNLLSGKTPSTFEFHGNPPYRVKGNIANSVFLLGSRGPKGSISDPKEIFKMMAIQLYGMIGTPLGVEYKSVTNNNTSVDEIDPRGGKRFYSSFGMIGLDYDLATRRFRAESGIAASAAALIRLGGNMDELDEGRVQEEASYLARLYNNGTAAPRINEVVGSMIHELKLSNEEKERPSRIIDSLETKFKASLESSLDKQIRDTVESSYTAVPEGWKASFEHDLSELVNRHGTQGATRIMAALEGVLKRNRLELEEREAAKVPSALAKDAVSSLEKIGAFTQLFKPDQAMADKAAAVEAFNFGIERFLRDAAAKHMLTTVFGKEGLLKVLSIAGQRVQDLDDTVRKTEEQLRTDSKTGKASATTALDSSLLIYDLMREGSGELGPEEAGQGRQCLNAWIGQDSVSPQAAARIAASLHANAAEATRMKTSASSLLAQSLRTSAAHLVDGVEHILDVWMKAAESDRGHSVSDAFKNLSVMARVDTGHLDSRNYNLTRALVPRTVSGEHPYQAAFANALNSFCAAEQMEQVDTNSYPGRPNRIIMSTWMHGFALNDSSLPFIEKLRTHYRSSLKTSRTLEVDKRWMLVPGPGMQVEGGRSLVWALGVAYGLIAQDRGSRFYNNLITQHNREPELKGTREAHEVDAEGIMSAIGSRRPASEWMPKIIQKPSSQTLTKKKIASLSGLPDSTAQTKRVPGDLIGNGRFESFRNFSENIGEDFEDLEIGICLVLKAILESQGIGRAIADLEGYVQQLSSITFADETMKMQIENEIDMISLALKNLKDKGDLGLPVR